MSVRDDPAGRPPDPAGTRPRHDPQALLPPAQDRAAPTEPPPAEVDALGSEPTAAAAPASPAPEPPHAPRFQFLLGALVTLGAAALAAVVLLAAGLGGGGQDREAGAQPWASWEPTEEGDRGIAEIARYVALQYRANDRTQLLDVRAASLQDVPVAVRLPASAGGDIAELPGRTVLFQMCGLGERCTIPRGEPSKERGLLVAREALELALRSLRHDTDLEQVVTALPPAGATGRQNAYLFRREVLAPLLRRPLAQTLSPRTPTVRGVDTSPDATRVAALTQPFSHRFAIVRNEEQASQYAVLEPIAPESGGPQQLKPLPQTPPSPSGSRTSRRGSGSSGSGSGG